MKFEKGKQYKCVESPTRSFTVGKVYTCKEDGYLISEDGRGIAHFISLFTLHEEEVKRGDYALFWNEHEVEAEKRIYLTTIEGSANKYIAVSKFDDDDFKKGKLFHHTYWKNMKPLPKPIEVPMKEALSILKAHKGSDCVIVEDEK